MRKIFAYVTSLVALAYGFFAGLRLVADPDLGWQLATGRWIVQHRAIPYTDVLSYTARGQQWIYPVLSQVILYCTYRLGGYALLSWLGAAACVATIALLLPGNPVSKVLAIFAVPLIAARTLPRAEMFSEPLIAAYLAILWYYHKTGRAKLWLLPLLMCLWVNLHPGFVAGFAICAWYVVVELADALLDKQRVAALQRLRHASPWLLGTLLATVVNPWGPRIYIALLRQAEVLRVHNRWIYEWMSVPFTLGRLVQAFELRDPRSDLWWLLFFALLAVLAAAYQRRVGAVAILAGSVYLAIHSDRLEGPFASVVVIIGGSVLFEAFDAAASHRPWARIRAACGRYQPVAAALAIAALIAFASVRISDVVSNRFYFRTSDETSIFGAGEAAWYPEDAAAFLLRERPSGNLYNPYSLGGFAAWRLSPTYPDYIDGRAVPFGNDLFFRSILLMLEPLDSPQWQHEADGRNINTAMFSLDDLLRGGLPNLDGLYRSRQWRPVYLDTHAVIFERIRPEVAAPSNSSQVDWDKLHFGPPDAAKARGTLDRFDYDLNSAAILVAIGRNAEALRQLENAESIYPQSSSLHYLKALAQIKCGFPTEAEQELRTSLDIEPSDDAWLALARLYRQQGRYPEAAAVLGRAVKLSPTPFELYMELGVVQMDMGLPEQALASFDEVEKRSPFVDEAASLGAEFNRQMAEARANAWRKLAEMYQERGLRDDALRAMQQATSLQTFADSIGQQ